jgi:hypothetical protein
MFKESHHFIASLVSPPGVALPSLHAARTRTVPPFAAAPLRFVPLPRDPRALPPDLSLGRGEEDH